MFDMENKVNLSTYKKEISSTYNRCYRWTWMRNLLQSDY